MPSTIKRVRAVGLMAVAVTGLAGCGDDATTDPSGAAPTSTVTVSATVAPTATPTRTVTETVIETTTATVTPSPGDGGGMRDCGQVAFEPNTDDGAFDIRARGVDCPLAREVARAAEGRGGDRYRGPEGFDCRPAGTVGELPSVVYECRAGGSLVTFDAS